PPPTVFSFAADGFFATRWLLRRHRDLGPVPLDHRAVFLRQEGQRKSGRSYHLLWSDLAACGGAGALRPFAEVFSGLGPHQFVGRSSILRAAVNPRHARQELADHFFWPLFVGRGLATHRARDNPRQNQRQARSWPAFAAWEGEPRLHRPCDSVARQDAHPSNRIPTYLARGEGLSLRFYDDALPRRTRPQLE